MAAFWIWRSMARAEMQRREDELEAERIKQSKTPVKTIDEEIKELENYIINYNGDVGNIEYKKKVQSLIDKKVIKEGRNKNYYTGFKDITG